MGKFHLLKFLDLTKLFEVLFNSVMQAIERDAKICLVVKLSLSGTVQRLGKEEE